MLRRDVKRYCFFSSFSFFDKNIDTEKESDVNNYRFFKRRRLLKLNSVTTSLTDREINISDSIDTDLEKYTRQALLCYTAVVYEQQRWQREIIAEKDNSEQKRERRRKKYLIR